ncbi:MAG: Ig domain-containing protein [Prevotellaceae bacterium]|jgi:hypothetical protein|nr:Ig domain-containing protein [Prevotellaceae bacterium]
MKRKIKLMVNMLLVVAFAAVVASCSKDDPVPVTGVTLNKTTLTLAIGEKETLVATVSPSDATNKNVTWSSSNAYIAAINTQTGEVTGIANGTATITATTQDGSSTATCEVTVNDALRTYIKLALLQYTGTAVNITYIDGNTENITKNSDGTFHITKNDKTIKSITCEGGSPILIGRKANADLTFKINGTGIVFRDAVNDTIPIGSYAEFQLINIQLYGIYKQEADIDLMSEEWTPIGAFQRYFEGTFNGANYTLANLKITGNKGYIGLFGAGASSFCEIYNIHIISGSVSGSLAIGSVCGFAFAGASVNRCYSTCSVSGTNIQIGGICGLSLQGSISNCYYAGVVSCTNEYVGGVCGYNYDGSIWACYNAGSVTIEKNYAGGISGYNSLSGTITACYNTGTVLSYYNYAGGICGYNRKNITACYNTGNVSAGGNGVGGVCGLNSANVTACYSTGSLMGNSNVGGVTGENSATVTACYWKDVTGDDADYGIGTPASNTNATPFSENAWPDVIENAEWGIGNGSGSGTYWKSLGGWNNGNPVYPKLYFEE